MIWLLKTIILAWLVLSLLFSWMGIMLLSALMIFSDLEWLSTIGPFIAITSTICIIHYAVRMIRG